MPVARIQRPVSPPGSVGAERSPLATSARAGRRDGGGHTRLPLWGSWHDEVVTERAPFQGGSQRGRRQSPPLELNYITFSPSRTSRGTYTSLVWAREGVSERRWRSAANRSQLPLRSALNGRHWRPAPEPAGETRGWGADSCPPAWRQARRVESFSPPPLLPALPPQTAGVPPGGRTGAGRRPAGGRSPACGWSGCRRWSSTSPGTRRSTRWCTR